jgi:hypothetical protein
MDGMVSTAIEEQRVNDREVLGHIQELVDEEHDLLEREGRGELSDPHQRRRREIEAHLDQLWDLLRQRRARREFGLNPDEAQERPVEVVEHYQQ